MANRFSPNCCCGCKDLSRQLWPDIYERETVTCFVRERTVTQTTTNWGAPGSVTTETDVTVESTDTQLRAGNWQWTKTEIIAQPDGSNTLVATRIYEDRWLAIQFDVSDQFAFGELTENGLDVVTDMTALFRTTDSYRSGYANGTPTRFPAASVYGIYAGEPMPTDIDEFESILLTSDVSGTIDANKNSTSPGNVTWSLASHVPDAPTDTLLMLIGDRPGTSYYGIQISDIRLSVLLNRPTNGTSFVLNASYSWRHNFNRTSPWTYVSKKPDIVPTSAVSIRALGVDQGSMSSGITTTTPNIILDVDLLATADGSPVFSFTWDYRDEVSRTGVIPPGTPDLLVAPDLITAQHAGVPPPGTVDEFPIDPPVKKYFIRLTFRGNSLVPGTLQLECETP